MSVNCCTRSVIIDQRSVLRQVVVSSRSPKTMTGVGFEPTTFGLVLQRSSN